MKSVYFLPCLLMPLSAVAADITGECSKPGRSIDQEMRIVMAHTLNIDLTQLDERKTRTEILFAEPAGERLIAQFAQETYDALTEKGKSSPASYQALFSGEQVMNIGLRITYVNKADQKNVFIASGLADQHECSVRFNGWLTVQREF